MGITLYLVNQLCQLTEEETNEYIEGEDSTYEDYFFISRNTGNYTSGSYLGVNHCELNCGSLGFYAVWMEKLASVFDKKRQDVKINDPFGHLLTQLGYAITLSGSELDTLIQDFNAHKALVLGNFDNEEYREFYTDLEGFFQLAKETDSVVLSH